MKGVDRKVVTQSQIEISLMVCSSALRDWLHFSRSGFRFRGSTLWIISLFLQMSFSLFTLLCKQVLTIYIRFEFILHSEIGIESGLMTTIHSYTNDQLLVDSIHSDIRRARSATLSMIPTKTGAAICKHVSCFSYW